MDCNSAVVQTLKELFRAPSTHSVPKLGCMQVHSFAELRRLLTDRGDGRLLVLHLATRGSPVGQVGCGRPDVAVAVL